MIIEEVHLWRGSPEQRALRSQRVKTTQFAYFDRQLDHPDWRGKSVLDFGGNRGNMLLETDCPIRQQNYYCVDVIQDAIRDGRSMFPDAHWSHYDRYNCSFNPEGNRDLPIPDFRRKFDIILAYSVFTHTTLEEMKDLVMQLETKLAPGGSLAFTFIDPHYSAWPDRYHGNNLVWRLEREIYLEGEKGNTLDIDVQGLADEAKDAAWFVLVNGEDLYLETEQTRHYAPDEQRTYHMFYTVEYMKSLFPTATILPPVNDEMQHCCVIRK